VRSKGLNGITSAKVAEQIMDNALRIADASSRRPSNLGKDLAMDQPTADGQCKSSVMERNALTESNLGEKSNGAAISHAKSCPSQFLETNLGKQHHLSGYKIQEFREKDIFNHSNSSAFSRYIMLINFCYLSYLNAAKMFSANQWFSFHVCLFLCEVTCFVSPRSIA
jgi:pseudo-response regulator 5